MTIASTVDFGTTRDGLLQLRRRWVPAEARAAMLLVHGIGEHSGRYEHVGSFLAERGIDVIAIDQRGHGQSGGRRVFVREFDDFCADVEDQLAEVRRLGLPTILLGHSMGGLVSASYAVSNRPQPDLLVLSGPALGVDVPPALRTALPVLAKIAPTLFSADSIDASILSTDPDVAADYVSDPHNVLGNTVNLGAELLSAADRVSGMLERIRVPTLVQHGENDRLVPAWASEPLVGLDDTTRITYPGMAHEIYNEVDKRRVLMDLWSWLDAQLGRLSA